MSNVFLSFRDKYEIFLFWQIALIMTNETFLMQVPPNFYQRNILGFALTLIICSDVDKQITQRFAKMHLALDTLLGMTVRGR